VIVNQIITEHGGSIHVESEPGQGTKFQLSFFAMQNELFASTERPVMVEPGVK